MKIASSGAVALRVLHLVVLPLGLAGRRSEVPSGITEATHDEERLLMKGDLGGGSEHLQHASPRGLNNGTTMHLLRLNATEGTNYDRLHHRIHDSSRRRMVAHPALLNTTTARVGAAAMTHRNNATEKRMASSIENNTQMKYREVYELKQNGSQYRTRDGPTRVAARSPVASWKRTAVGIGFGCILGVVIFVVFMTAHFINRRAPVARNLYNPSPKLRARKLSEDGDSRSDHASHASLSDKEEMPRTANDLRSILTSHNVDFSSWGKAGLKSVEDLFDEIMNAKCALKYVRGDNGVVCLEREVRIVSMKLRAETSRGVHWLKTNGACGNRAGSTMYSFRDCSRKVTAFADLNSEVREMLFRELGLSLEWQEAHLALEKVEVHPGVRDPGHGHSLPGLSTHYYVHRACMLLLDVNAPGCNGILGLPDGENFQTTEIKNTDNRIRYWSWQPTDKGDGTFVPAASLNGWIAA